MEDIIRVKDLINLLKVPSMSKKEYYMRKFIVKKLKEMNVPYTEDETGNIYNLIPNTPLLSAHMDTVGDAEDIAVLNFIYEEKGIISGFGNIGADDKVGIFIILELLKRYENISFVFTVQEETGSVGARMFVNNNSELLNELLYCIVIDRRGDSDIISTQNDYCVQELENDILSIITGFKPALGSISDADVFNDYLSCINISCGYYKPHTQDEFIIWSNVVKTYHAVKTIITKLINKYEIPVKTKYSWSSSSAALSKYGKYPRDYYDYEKDYSKYNSSSYTSKLNKKQEDLWESNTTNTDDVFLDMLEEIIDLIYTESYDLDIDLEDVIIENDQSIIVKGKFDHQLNNVLLQMSNLYGVVIKYVQ